MSPEAVDRGGTPILTRGFYGGSFSESRIGIPPSELLNVGDARDRQKVFYSGVAQLADLSTAYTNYWRPGGAMSSLQSEFSVAVENARSRAGVVIPEEVKSAYEERVVAYVSCMGLASGIMHCDGTAGFLAESIIPQEYEIDKGWDSHKAEMMMSDPAINFPLSWIRDYADSGTLPAYWLREKQKDMTAIPEFVTKMAGAMAASPEWDAYCQHYQIPRGIEKELVKIALGFYIVEDLPVLQGRLARGEVEFTDPRIDQGRDVVPESSNCGFLPFDNVYYGTYQNPVGILKFKGVFPDDPEIVRGVEDFFTYAGNVFGGGQQRMMDKRPSQISVKDMKRYAKVWDMIVGGSQGTSMADFSKFGEAIAALCNLYNMPGEKEMRADVIGWMVGEAVYIKAKALMAGVPDGEVVGQLMRVLSLGDFDTPQELDRVQQGVLGSQGVGFFGALQVARQFGLRIGTPHYNEAVAMLKTGIKDPRWAKVGQDGMVVAAAFNRFLGGASGRKRK